jgi:predicted phosphate transport protein (TIGR00153 family)
MRNLMELFGKSPFEPLVEHARKVHQCVSLIRPIADAIVAGDMERLTQLQHDMSKAEYEADQVKDEIRKNLPARYFLPVNRDELARHLSQVDKIADDAEDFAVVATFRQLKLPAGLHAEFFALVDKVVAVSEALLGVAEQMGRLQKGAFTGPDAEEVLRRIEEVCHMEWESDKLSRKFARQYYSLPETDAITLILLDKLCKALGGIADHAENVGKNLRLMITRK